MLFFPLILIGPAIFLMIKLVGNGVRFSDTNVYFYTAQELLQGKVLYKDIFFTNLPFFPYFTSFYAFFHNVSFYYFTAAIETVATSFILFFIIREKVKDEFLGLLGMLAYLFSFIVLSTSDHQTGIFLASFLSVLAYYLLIKKSFVASGIILGLMVCTKAYYLPIAGAFIIYEFFNNKKSFIKMLVGFVLAVAVCLLPFVLLAKNAFVKDVITYSLFRPQGIGKLPVFMFFITKDPLLFIAFLFLIVSLKKDRLLFLISFFSLIFFLIYKDVYYLYFNLVAPFLVLALVELCRHIQKQHCFLVVGLFLLFNLYVYFGKYINLQKIDNIDEMVRIIKSQKASVLYGVEELTPALSYLSGVPLLDKIIDTNENLFITKTLNARALTQKAIGKNALIVVKGDVYPQAKIYQPMLTKTIDPTLFTKHCKPVDRFPFQSEGLVNTIGLYRCYP